MLMAEKGVHLCMCMHMCVCVRERYFQLLGASSLTVAQRGSTSSMEMYEDFASLGCGSSLITLQAG